MDRNTLIHLIRERFKVTNNTKRDVFLNLIVEVGLKSQFELLLQPEVNEHNCKYI